MDETGNTTILIYTEKLPSPPKRDAINLISLTYNNATTTLADTALKYKWANKPDGSYRMFVSHLQTSATTTESHYRPKKNITIIMTKPVDLDDDEDDDESDTRPTKQKLPGFIIPALVTERGVVKVDY